MSKGLFVSLSQSEAFHKAIINLIDILYSNTSRSNRGLVKSFRHIAFMAPNWEIKCLVYGAILVPKAHLDNS
jgi:hypothetical protein